MGKSSGGSLHHAHILLVFVVIFYWAVGNVRRRGQELVFEFSIVFSDNFSLFFLKRHHLTFLFLGHALESRESLCHFGFQQLKQLVSLISHFSSLDAVESSFERSSFDGSSVDWVIDFIEHCFKRSLDRISEFILQVVLLKVLNLVKHRNRPVMESCLSVQFAVCQEVDEWSLLDILVLLVDSLVLDLFLGVSQVLVLGGLSSVHPHVHHLLELVLGVNAVKHWELWAEEVGKVSDLDITDVEGEQELMVEDQGSQPVVVFKAAHIRHSHDRRDICSKGNQTSSRSAQWLVVGRDLLWTDSGEHVSQEVKVRHVDWRPRGVVRMDIANLHVGHSRSIPIACAVLSLVLGFRAVRCYWEINKLTSLEVL